MTERNKLLRDALRRVETVAQTALAHQPDGDAACETFLRIAVGDCLVALANVVRREDVAGIQAKIEGRAE